MFLWWRKTCLFSWNYFAISLLMFLWFPFYLNILTFSMFNTVCIYISMFYFVYIECFALSIYSKKTLPCFYLFKLIFWRYLCINWLLGTFRYFGDLFLVFVNTITNINMFHKFAGLPLWYVCIPGILCGIYRWCWVSLTDNC